MMIMSSACMAWGFFGVALRLPSMEGSDSAAISARSLAGSRLGAACAEAGATPERETGGLALGDGAGAALGQELVQPL